VTAVSNMQFVLPKNLPRFYLPAERGLVQIAKSLNQWCKMDRLLVAGELRAIRKLLCSLIG
jgi:hypothetical protein